jgi:alkane 1-monooxygenase
MKHIPPSLARALPFWLSILLAPILALSAWAGGWLVLLAPVYVLVVFPLLDWVTGLNTDNTDPDTPKEQLFWYRLVTLIWAPIQLSMLLGLIYYAPRSDLGVLELIGLFYALGVTTGTIGINYAHELMHQPSRLERWMGDILLASVLYSHFRSEHLLVHHRHVGTPRDAVTARYNQNFYRYYGQVLRNCPRSAFAAEAAMLARKDLPWHHPSNPFWRYAALQAIMLTAAIALGGWIGLALFIWQALIAITFLELVNYIEHYGLTRKYLGDGKYETVAPHHSWNAAHRASNWLLINLQRHSDHHYKPARPFPLLQNYDADQAPQLPYGYPVLGFVALVPGFWRRYMNPRVRRWRAMYYPEITDWTAYDKGLNPPPK